MPPTGDLARNPGMCPDWESNQGPLASQASTQSTEPHQPVHKDDILNHGKIEVIELMMLKHLINHLGKKFRNLLSFSFQK